MRTKITVIVVILFLSFSYKETVRTTVNPVCETREICLFCFPDAEKNLANTLKKYQTRGAEICRFSSVYERELFVSGAFGFYADAVRNLPPSEILSGGATTLLNLELKLILLILDGRGL